MEVHSKEESEMKQEKSSRIRKGGFRTMPFILANESFEKVASFGLTPNMILYLMFDYGMSYAKGTNVILIWSAASNLLAIVGAFLADSFLGRFLTIFLGSIVSLMGMILLWLTTVIHDAKPPPCDIRHLCLSPTPIQYTLLLSAFALMSIGAGGVRPCSLAFGANQIDSKDNSKRQRLLESFFGWYYSLAIMAVMIALTGIVYIQDHHGWRIGFGVPVILMFLSTFFFVVAYPLYYNMKVERSLFTSLCQVISVAWKNRRLELPDSVDISWYNKIDSNVTKPTDNLRFLNKACILSEPQSVTNAAAVALDPWTMCTVDQVEELKALIRVIPLWSSCIMLSVNNSQNTFPVLQARAMDRHLTSTFEIPAASFSFFTLVAIMVWVMLYDRVIVPLLSKIQGKPAYISVKLRMGAGLACSIISMVISGIVEHVRRNKAIEAGFLNNPQGVIKMSAMWVIPQHVLNGLADALNIIGQNEFFYTEFPKSMSSIAMALYMLGAGIASLLASLILSTVDDLTKGNGKDSWVSTNINKGHYDKYYWLLGIMSCINFFYHVVCSWSYRSRVDKTVVEGNKTNDSGDEHGPKS